MCIRDRCFDERKVNWLLDGLRHTNPQINQRALVGLVITLHLYSSRIALYPELEARISLFREDPNFSKQVNRIYIQLLRSQETEKIDRKMREEIIPEMMKNVNIMRNMKSVSYTHLDVYKRQKQNTWWVWHKCW